MKKLTNLFKKNTGQKVETTEWYDGQIVTANNSIVKVSVQAVSFDDAHMKICRGMHESCTFLSVEKRIEG